MRYIFAVIRLVLIIPFTPIILPLLMLVAFDWEDFKDQFVDLYWSA
jgi:hypothetical protein